ncbi:MAG: large subunit ribosomal protein [Patescibacteria group bacterium]|nr:large subunit ribosomal protein [Patescibacteria group bacterium]
MKVILLENIPGVGQKGDVKEVSEGHAMNFLLPQKKAILATAQSVKYFQHQKDEQEKNLAEQQSKYSKIVKNLNNQSLNFIGKTSAQKNLFAGIGIDEIINFVKKNYNLDIHSNWFVENYFFKTIGKFPVVLKLPSNAKISLTIIIKSPSEKE